jgi:hypothetical protein
LISVQVTEAVVDVLESVEVKKEERKTLFRVAVCAGKGVAQPIHEHRPVGETGERILKARGSHCFPRLVLLIDVGLPADDTDRLSVGIFDDLAPGQHPPVVAAVDQNSVPLLDDGHLSGDACVDNRTQPGQILRVDPAQPALEVVLDLLR